MSQYGDPGYMEQDLSPMLYRTTFTVLGFALVVVILRLFCRLYLLRARALSLSEWLIILSVVVDVASCIMIHFQIRTGMGRHIEYSRARPEMLQQSMKVGLAQNSLYQLLIGVIKTSIMAQYDGFALPGSQKRWVRGIGVFVVVFTLFTTFAAIFQCIPIHAAWDLANFPRGCWNMMGINFFTSSVNTIVDVVIFVLPFPVMLKLQIATKRKILLVATFAVGLLAIACSIVRLRNIVHFNGVGDFTYRAAMVPVWGAIECNAGIISASVPSLAPLVKWVNGTLSQDADNMHRNGFGGASTRRATNRRSTFVNKTDPWASDNVRSDSTEAIVHPFPGSPISCDFITKPTAVHCEEVYLGVGDSKV